MCKTFFFLYNKVDKQKKIRYTIDSNKKIITKTEKLIYRRKEILIVQLLEEKEYGKEKSNGCIWWFL